MPLLNHKCVDTNGSSIFRTKCNDNEDLSLYESTVEADIFILDESLLVCTDVDLYCTPLLGCIW